MNFCPESEFRDSLDDGEFWEYVLLGIRPGDPPPDRYDDEDEVAPLAPCPVCGAITACGYDEEGRALIHAVEDEDEAQL